MLPARWFESRLYEQIKTDLDYLKLKRAGEVFATLADDAKAHWEAPV